MKNLFALITLLFCSLFLIQCEDKETDELYSAQRCLNTATAATVDACLDKISGNTSSLAFSLRCGASFTKQNITDTRIVNALKRLDENNDPTKDPMTDLMAALVFSTVTAANEAIDLCTASGSKGMLGLARISQMATLTATILAVPIDPVNGIDAGVLDAAIDGYGGGGGPAEKEALGATIVSSFPDYCGDGGQFKDEEICTNLSNAIATGSDNQSIAEALINNLQNDD